jgi:hypothetical protein
MDKLTETQEESLNYIFERVKAGGDSSLTPWEISFVKDLEERYDRWQTNLRVSERQWSVIERIEGKL